MARLTKETPVNLSAAPTPVIASARTYYGVHVIDVGEDGDLLVLGHDHPERRVIAALNAHIRYLGHDYGESLEDSYQRAVSHLKTSWAQLHTECCGTPLSDPEHPEARCPDGCDDHLPADKQPYREYAWCADYDAKPHASGAFPVVVWRS